MIRLGVNIDHVATLRQVRLARYPDIVEAMHLCERGGADQITVHLREDRRHIQEEDVNRLLECSLLPINLEMACVDEMFQLAKRWKCYSVTLVPERREEMTTESGLDLQKLTGSAKKKVAELLKITRVYSFVDPDLAQVQLSKDMGFDGVEFHTGTYAEAFEKSLRGRKDEALKRELRRLWLASEKALELALQVKAGHGLTIQNVIPLKELPGLEELNIGHSIVARSVLMGLEQATREMKQALL